MVPLDPDRPYHIAPPFGTYFTHPRAYSHLGSFTRLPRPGRTGRILGTVRPVPSDAGPAWINKIGLRNPGIWEISSRSGYVVKKSHVFSLAPLEITDWNAFERLLDSFLGRLRVEFNVSCPNVDDHPELPHDRQIGRILANCSSAIFKLPPLPASVDVACRLFELGARYVHLSNTISSPIGGISGAPLREVNLPLVEAAARAAPAGCEVIAGGGILSDDHIRQYADAGATRFSLGVAFFWPPRAYRAMRKYHR